MCYIIYTLIIYFKYTISLFSTHLFVYCINHIFAALMTELIKF